MITFGQNKFRKMDDEKLLRQFCKGQQQAFNELYHRHADPLYRFILRQSNQQTALAEEVFQDTWLNIIKSSELFRSESKFSTYLYKIARNKLIDQSRKAVTHKSADHDNNIEQLANPDSQQPDNKTQLELCIELLQKYIQQLPDDQREAFVLKQESSHTLTELAEILHTSLETLKSRLRYAIRKLRDWLPGECL